MKGLSPIVSTIVLIVAAVIGGMMAYQYFISTMSAISSKSVVTISQASLYDNKVLFIDVDVFSKSNNIAIEGIEIICGSNITTVTASSASPSELRINGTTIIYTSTKNICNNVDTLLVSVIYKENNEIRRTEPVKPIIH